MKPTTVAGGRHVRIIVHHEIEEAHRIVNCFNSKVNDLKMAKTTSESS